MRYKYRTTADAEHYCEPYEQGIDLVECSVTIPERVTMGPPINYCPICGKQLERAAKEATSAAQSAEQAINEVVDR